MAIAVTDSAPAATRGLVRVATYRRISGHIDQLRGQSLLVQALATQEFVDRHGGVVVYEFEDAESGWCLTRRDYQKILEVARQGKIDAICMFRLDRFGRDNGEAIQRCDELTRDYGVSIWSVNEGINISKPQRDIALSMAAWESEANSTRGLPVMRWMAEEGYWPGRPPFGYRMDTSQRDGHDEVIRGLLVPYEPEARLVKEIFARFDAGETLYSVACWLNTLRDEEGNPVRPKWTPKTPRKAEPQWSTTMLRGMLQNKVYIGQVVFDRTSASRFRPKGTKDPQRVIIAQGKHRALIERDQFASVQERLALNRHQVTASAKVAQAGRRFLLQGLVICGHCGRSMYGQIGHRYDTNDPTKITRTDVQYRCQAYKHACIGGPKLDRFVLAALEYLRLSPDQIHRAVERLRAVGDGGRTSERARLEQQIGELEDAIERAGLHLARGTMKPERYTQTVDALERELGDAKTKLAHIKARPEPVELLDWAARELEKWDTWAPLLRYGLASGDAAALDRAAAGLARAIERIEVKRGEEPQIVWRPWASYLLGEQRHQTQGQDTSTSQEGTG